MTCMFCDSRNVRPTMPPNRNLTLYHCDDCGEYFVDEVTRETQAEERQSEVKQC
jgi:transcription elongation factor Elf1